MAVFDVYVYFCFMFCVIIGVVAVSSSINLHQYSAFGVCLGDILRCNFESLFGHGVSLIICET